MTTRSRRPDRKGPADIADGSCRRRVEAHVAAHEAPAPVPILSDKRRSARKEHGLAVAGRRDESLWAATKRWSALLVVAACLAVVAGCSDDGEASLEPRPTTTSRPGTTSTTEPNAEEQVVERYLAFWDARLEANNEPVNPDHPGLREYATGEQLDQVLLETTQRRDQGLAIRRAADPVGEHRVEVLGIDGETATLQDCATDDDVVYRVATGEVVNDRVATLNVEATMRVVDGEWKLARTRVVQRWEGVAGCARSSGS